MQTDCATLAQVVEGRQLEEMPLIGRNVMNQVSLVPGVVTHRGAGGSPLNNQAASGNSTNPQEWDNTIKLAADMQEQATSSWTAFAPIRRSAVLPFCLPPRI